jgi:hypothetical protein
MVFKNIRLFFLGSDDFPKHAKIAARVDLNAALEAGWPGFEIAAHELTDRRLPSRVSFSGRVFRLLARIGRCVTGDGCLVESPSPLATLAKAGEAHLLRDPWRV